MARYSAHGRFFSNFATGCGNGIVVSSRHKPKATQHMSIRAGTYTHVRSNPKSMLFLLLIFKFENQGSVYISIHKAHYVC